MTIICELDIIPVRKGSMAEGIAKALEELEKFNVSYETYPMGTVIEADSLDELFEAIKAAHRAVDEDRVITQMEIDDKRVNPNEKAEEKVKKVEEILGRKAKSQS